MEEKGISGSGFESGDGGFVLGVCVAGMWLILSYFTTSAILSKIIESKLLGMI
jgi:hypothetical protein